MKACVFSDSHGVTGHMITAIELEKPDICFFLGDGEREEDLRTLTYQAKEAGADIALFGHTHYQHLSENDGVTLLNPGTIGYGYYCSYAVLNIENGEFNIELKGI